MIVGAGFSGQAILRQSLQNNIPIRVIGFLDDDIGKIGRKIHGVSILSRIDEINKIEEKFDEIFICIPSANRIQMSRLVDLCKESGKPVKTLPSLSEVISEKVSFSQLRKVSILDLLGRDEVKLNIDSINKTFKGKRVVITGAGGSIGSELVRQCLNFSPSLLIMIDISELNLFEIDRQLNQNDTKTLLKPILCDIRDYSTLQDVFEEYKPQVVLHAAHINMYHCKKNFLGKQLKLIFLVPLTF